MAVALAVQKTAFWQHSAVVLYGGGAAGGI